MGKFIALIFFFATSGQAAIYGADQRADLYLIPQYRDVGKAVAVGENLLAQNPDGTFRIEMTDKLGFLCSDEKFYNQTSLGVCTGFLISERLLVTAGHCGLATGTVDDRRDPFCQNFVWYFDYTLDARGNEDSQSIPEDRLYRCRRTIRAENIVQLNPDGSSRFGNDFSVIELDRAVDPGLAPLPIAKRPAAIGDPVYTIGHPFGTPSKFSGFAAVIGVPEAHYFAANLDTQSGNSGGPVLNAANEVVGILVSGHPVDTYTDHGGKCERFNVCKPDGTGCKEESRFENQQKSNFIQRIETVFAYLGG